MGLFGRIRTLISANLNDALDRAEDPESMLKQWMRDLEGDIDKAKIERAKILADAGQSEKALAAKAEEVERWTRRAELAIDGGDDDLARRALERKLRHAEEVKTLQGQLEQTHAAAEEIRGSIQAMADKLAEVDGRYKALKAKEQAVVTERAERRATAALDAPGTAMDRLDRLDRKLAELGAVGQVEAELHSEAELEKQFQVRETKAALDAELAALKARVQRERT